MVMYQQTGKAIFKLLRKVLKGDKIFGTFEYLTEINLGSQKLKIDDVYSLKFLIDVIKVSALYQISKTHELLQSDDGLEWPSKWNKRYQLDVVKSVKLHSIYTTASIFYQEINGANVSDSLKQKLTTLCKIYACDQILKH